MGKCIKERPELEGKAYAKIDGARGARIAHLPPCPNVQ